MEGAAVLHSAAGRRLDDAMAALTAARPQLLDAWEAAIVLESIGYTADRVRREFGLADTRALAEVVFARLAERAAPPSPDDAVPLAAPGRTAAARASALALGFYGLLWAAVLVAERGALAFVAGPPPTLALMAALIVAAGLAAAMAQRVAFHAALGQDQFARQAASLCWRAGALATLIVAVAAVSIAWMARPAAWPGAVLWAEQFVLLSAVLLTATRLLAVGWSWAGRRTAAQADAATVPPPRMAVVFVRMLPAVAVGSGGFVIAFFEWLSPAALGMAAGPVPLGAAVALFPLLAAFAAVEYVAPRFVERIAEASTVSFAARSALTRAALRAYWRGVAVVALAFVATAIVTALAAPIGPALVAGYLLLALAMLNARLLLACGRRGVAAAATAAGVVVTTGAMAATFLWPGVPETGLPIAVGSAAALVVSWAGMALVFRHPELALLRA